MVMGYIFGDASHLSPYPGRAHNRWTQNSGQKGVGDPGSFQYPLENILVCLQIKEKYSCRSCFQEKINPLTSAQ